MEKKYKVISIVSLRNTDKYGGYFVVLHKLYSPSVTGLLDSIEDSIYLAPDESIASTATFDVDEEVDAYYPQSYDVTPPTVIDTRLVAKGRTAYKSIIELLFWG